MSKKEKPFHNPFGKVKLPEPPAPKALPPDPAVKKAPAPLPRRSEGLSEDELWTMAVDGAEPLPDRKARIKPAPQPLSLAPGQPDPDLAAYDELRALVTGEVAFDISDTDEFIEGHAKGLDPRVVRKLRRAEFAVQAHLDLHGLLKDQAKVEMEGFLTHARHSGRRCVLVVHGRGLHSKDQVPVLKEALKRWMSTGRFAKHVLAFATARPHDGGAGAMYVLLRRP